VPLPVSLRRATALKKVVHKRSGVPRGGLATRLYLTVDSARRPLRLFIAGGKIADISRAAEPVERMRTAAVIADKGYDSNYPVNHIRADRGEAVIPPHSNRTTKRCYSRALYRIRNFVLANAHSSCASTPSARGTRLEHGADLARRSMTS
jgi:hypothetical protein